MPSWNITNLAKGNLNGSERPRDCLKIAFGRKALNHGTPSTRSQLTQQKPSTRYTMNRQTNKFHRDLKHLSKKEMNMNKTIEQLEKDIAEKRNFHIITLDNIKRLRDSLQLQPANLEYIVTELGLLKAELSRLKEGNG